MRIALAPVALLTVCAFGTATPTPAAAQNYREVVRNQLSRAASDIRQHGYAPDQDVVIGSLRDDASEAVVVSLQAGVQYAVVGVCDQDCTDVDLRIYSPSGQQLDEDIETDDTPVVEFVAPVAGQYRLSVIMAACSQNPCFYGFQIFRRQGGK